MNSKVPFRIQSPFLKHFILFYGNFGLHLRPVSPRDIVSCVSYLFSILFFILFNIFNLIISEIQKNDRSSLKYSYSMQQKPLFSLVLHSISYSIPFVFNLSMVHFLIKGSQISRLLDSPIFKNETSSLLNKNWIIPLLFIFDQLTILPLFYQYIFFFKYNNLLFYGIMMLISKQAPDVPFRLVAYYKYLTWKILKDFEESNVNTTANSQNIAVRVAELAILNKQLNSLLSLPLVLFMASYSAQILTLTCVSFSLGVNFQGIIFFMPFFLCVAFICFCCREIELSVKRLSGENLKNNNDFSKKYTSISAFNQNFLMVHKLSSSAKPDLTKTKTSKRVFHLHHLFCIYGCYFQLQLFHIFTFNLSFFIALALFLLNYAVLMYQTR